MSPFFSGRPAKRPGRTLAPVVVSLALAATGCAKEQAYREQSWNAGAPPAQVAQASVRRGAVEDDGLPAQTPPLKREQPFPDDPAEPWSRNYGPKPGPNPWTPTVKRADAVAPDARPADLRGKLRSAMAE